MKILLFSDSHGNVNNMIKALNRHKDIDLVIHLGDCLKDAISLQELYKDIPVTFVRGNNDWSRNYPSEKLLDTGGKKLFITHGHDYNVKYDYRRVIEKGRELAADAVFFGHTHRPDELFSEGMLVLNPGSIGQASLSGNPGYCLLEIREGRILSRFFRLFSEKAKP